MDYDVAVTGLSSPPPSAVLTPYRPAVSVRNNGLHDALASGYLRIYSAGLRIFETEVYSGTLAPGASGTADAVDYWTPPAEGQYIIQGYVSTPLDQVEHNNNLAPVTITVTGAEPPEPPTVPLHAAQHEEGGEDPINVDGLPGVLTDRQLPSAHAAQHQAGQTDVLNVSGLAGILGDPQSPIVHGNAHHNPVMLTAAELTAHAGAAAAHTAATNLANRETTGPGAGLVPAAQISLGSSVPGGASQGLRFDRYWGPVKATNIGDNSVSKSLLPGIMYETIHSIAIPVDWQGDNMHTEIDIYGTLLVDELAQLNLRLEYGLGGTSWCTIYLNGNVDPERHFHAKATITGAPVGYWTGMLEWTDVGQSWNLVTGRINIKDAISPRPGTTGYFSVSAMLTSGVMDSILYIRAASALSIRPQP